MHGVRFSDGGGATEMQLLHSIGTYARPMSGDTPRLMGFVGERDAANHLHPTLVAIPPDKAWKWKTITARYDGMEAERYFSTGGGQQTLAGSGKERIREHGVRRSSHSSCTSQTTRRYTRRKPREQGSRCTGSLWRPRRGREEK